MGQQLIGRPLSQRTSFGTLNTPSSATNPLQALMGAAPDAIPASPAGPVGIPKPPIIRPPITIGGFRGFGGMPRYGRPIFREPMNG